MPTMMKDKPCPRCGKSMLGPGAVKVAERPGGIGYMKVHKTCPVDVPVVEISKPDEPEAFPIPTPAALLPKPQAPVEPRQTRGGKRK